MSQVTLLWVPRSEQPDNHLVFVDAIAAAIPNASVVVRLERPRSWYQRTAWRVTHARAGTSYRALNAPGVEEYRARVIWALTRAGLWILDCPVCGLPFDRLGVSDPRPLELRDRVAPAHVHARCYWHERHACVPLDFSARYRLPCACGSTFHVDVSASETLASGGAVRCSGCGISLHLEAISSGGGLRIDPVQ